MAATRRGVFSFLTKPFEPKVLLDTVAEAMRLSSPILGDMEDWRAELITRSSAMEDLLAQARRVAASDASVCIFGRERHGQGAAGPGDPPGEPAGARRPSWR